LKGAVIVGKLQKTMDGNEAAAYVSYAFTEVSAIYPITPSSPMAEYVDQWAANGKKNIFGQKVRLIEMQSEAGAAAALHGAMEAGVLTSSYTSSQGLILMIPTMFRISGHLKAGVIHVAARSVATHAYSISAEHSDVMACRQTGFAMLASANAQEAMDLGAVAHLASLEGRVPFLHFFDGFRTSHEIQKIDCLDYNDLANFVDQRALQAFRKSALNPEHPVLRSSGQNPDTYFQSKEACNPYYENLPAIVEEYMEKINKLTGRDYKLFNYYGAAEAQYVIIAMGSVSGAIQETVDYLNARGEKVGFLQVHLYRPFSIKHFLAEMPKTVKKVVTLDRTKEPGAPGEPLYEDVCAACNETALTPEIIAGRFGIGGKDTSPAQIVAVFNNAKQAKPKNHFTVGINDDLTRHSLEVGADLDTVPKGTISCKIWGLGSDGTVGANKNSIKIIGDHTDLYVQAYFEYDGRKSGGVTKSHLRFGKKIINSSYYVKNADFVACHNQSYVNKYDLVGDLKPGGSFLLNCSWRPDELETNLPAAFKKYLAENNIAFYTIDATALAKDLGMGNRINTILQAAFFKIVNIIPIEQAVEYMKQYTYKTYASKGEQIVNMNYAAIEQGVKHVRKIVIPKTWAAAEAKIAEDKINEVRVSEEGLVAQFVRNHLLPMDAQRGETIPVSAFAKAPDGAMPCGTSKYERRGIAVAVPYWDQERCLQCNQCAYVCPHATIRPFLLTAAEAAGVPEGFRMVTAKGKGLESYLYVMQVDPLDCVGCGSCVNVCPAKGKALTMQPRLEQIGEMKNWDYALTLSKKRNPLAVTTVKGSQFEQPLLEFAGACPGCGETPYAKLVTQLYGDRMYIATATGCAQVWATGYPSFPYTVDANGHGPAYSNSLFENNAEFGLGMALGVEQQREQIRIKAQRLVEITTDRALKAAALEWLANFAAGSESKIASERFKEQLRATGAPGEAGEIRDYICANAEHLVKKSVWLFGGDGWAYDIGYGGLDHVLATGVDVNVLVLDTEVYSNTGGQASKATPRGAVAQFAASGRKSKKKDLGLMAISYGDVYVAQVAMGADQVQLLKAITEAEAYPGPALVIAYAPCVSHGLQYGMNAVQTEMKRAVRAGYWHLYRYNPLFKAKGQNPFILDSPAPQGDFQEFLKGETRFAALVRTFPEEAEVLFAAAEKDAKARYETYRRIADGSIG
jgi:pyruvate-ferredoxin/flavodoxin oxidoreductase